MQCVEGLPATSSRHEWSICAIAVAECALRLGHRRVIDPVLRLLAEEFRHFGEGAKCPWSGVLTCQGIKKKEGPCSVTALRVRAKITSLSGLRTRKPD